MNYRMEHDTMGEIAVPADRHWGAQTQRSLENFRIGGQRQPKEIITAFAYLKDACARANAQVGKLTGEQAAAISAACAENLAHGFREPLCEGIIENSSHQDNDEQQQNRCDDRGNTAFIVLQLCSKRSLLGGHGDICTSDQILHDEISSLCK